MSLWDKMSCKKCGLARYRHRLINRKTGEYRTKPGVVCVDPEY